MANLHEIKGRIENINATKKITRAMYLISASKSQKAKNQMESVFPYFQQIENTISEILLSSVDLETPYLTGPENAGEKPTLFVVFAGDKGMAGGYNHNLLELVEEHINKERDDLLVVGFIGRMQLRQLGYRVDPDVDAPVTNPNMYRARELSEQVLERFQTGRYRDVQVIYTEMESALKQTPLVLPLLPLNTDTIHQKGEGRREEIEYLPDPVTVFDHLVPHYVKGILYTALVEAFASEQHARMYAMDGATKSANDTIGRLSIQYNRARQAKITQELTEIIGGIPEEG